LILSLTVLLVLLLLLFDFFVQWRSGTARERSQRSRLR
jgi:uncharacterized membrane protein